MAKRAHRPVADSRAFMEGGDGTGAGAWGLPHLEGVAFGVRQAETVTGSSKPRDEETSEQGAGVEVAPRTVYCAPTFVELIPPRSGSFPECRVELELPRGRMRIELKGMATAELVALSRALWDGEA